MRRNQAAGAAVLYDFRNPLSGACDTGKAAGHGLQVNAAKAFESAGHSEDMAFIHIFPNLFRKHITLKKYVIVHMIIMGKSLQFFFKDTAAEDP